MAIVDELVTLLGVELSPSTLNNIARFKSGIDAVASKLKTFSVVASGAFAATGALVKSVVDESAQLQTTADKTGVSVEKLQEWAYAAKQVGVNAGAVQGDLAKFQKMLGFTGRDGEQQLLRLSNRLKNMTPERAQMYGNAFGLSSDTIVLLQQGEEGIKRLKSEANSLGFVISSENIKRLEKFRVTSLKLSETFKSFKTMIALSAVPAFEKATEKLTGWLNASKQVISSKLESFTQGLLSAWEKLYGVLNKVFERISPFIREIFSFKNSISEAEFATHVLTGALAGLALIFTPILAKLTLMGAAVTAVSLVIEDLLYWLNGDESLAGTMFDKLAEKIPGLVALLKTLKNIAGDVLSNVFEWFSEIGEALKSSLTPVFESFIVLVNRVATVLNGMISGFAERYPNIVKGFQAVADVVQSVLIGSLQAAFAVLEKLLNALGSVFELAGNVASGIMDFADKTLGLLFGEDVEAPAINLERTLNTTLTTPAQAAANAISNTDNRVNNITLNVNSVEQAQQAMSPFFYDTQLSAPGEYAQIVR